MEVPPRHSQRCTSNLFWRFSRRCRNCCHTARTVYSRHLACKSPRDMPRMSRTPRFLRSPQRMYRYSMSGHLHPWWRDLYTLCRSLAPSQFCRYVGDTRCTLDRYTPPRRCTHFGPSPHRACGSVLGSWCIPLRQHCSCTYPLGTGCTSRAAHTFQRRTARSGSRRMLAPSRRGKCTYGPFRRHSDGTCRALRSSARCTDQSRSGRPYTLNNTRSSPPCKCHDHS